MRYLIGEVAEKMSLTIYTLRYYDKQGLLPFVKRDENGRRIFASRDIILLNTIECMKATGMTIREIRQYVNWCIEGDNTIDKRYELVRNRKHVIEEQMKELENMLLAINYKCDFYKKASNTGEINMCEADRDAWANMILRQKEKYIK
ncbi:MAG: MerR family transcriptional regulator [Coprobacillaceae bacterium]